MQRNNFLFKAANETVYRGEEGERTVYLLPGETVILICQGERDVQWSKDGKVCKLFFSSNVISSLDGCVLICLPSPGCQIFGHWMGSSFLPSLHQSRLLDRSAAGPLHMRLEEAQHLFQLEAWPCLSSRNNHQVSPLITIAGRIYWASGRGPGQGAASH